MVVERAIVGIQNGAAGQPHWDNGDDRRRKSWLKAWRGIEGDLRQPILSPDGAAILDIIPPYYIEYLARALPNKRLSKGKKGIKKKVVDPFTRKEWYDIKAPGFFETRNAGKTLVNRSQGLKNADDSLKGRVLELSLADLMNGDQEQGFRKIKLRVEAISGKNCLTSFYGMDFTTDKLRSIVRKWQTLIEASVDVKTTDGYVLRLFAIGFTKRAYNQVKKTTYAQSSQVREIRAKMTEIMKREAEGGDLKELVQKFVPESIGREIEKATKGIYPLHNVYVRKAKIVKTPKLDMTKLLESNGETGADATPGSKVVKGGDFVEPEVLASV